MHGIDCHFGITRCDKRRKEANVNLSFGGYRSDVVHSLHTVVFTRVNSCEEAVDLLSASLLPHWLGNVPDKRCELLRASVGACLRSITHEDYTTV